MGTVSRYRVSAKIQQLLNPLKKPKRRPLNEFYEDADAEWGAGATNSRDTNAPAPRGGGLAGQQGGLLFYGGKGHGGLAAVALTDNEVSGRLVIVANFL